VHCNREAPVVAQLARRSDLEATILGVGSRDNAQNMADFVQRHELDVIDNVADYDQDVWRRNNVIAQPAWVFIDGETGESTARFEELDAEELAEEIKELGS
jgi:peroxiredoxin